jgi:integrase/ribosomal protein L40E
MYTEDVIDRIIRGERRKAGKWVHETIPVTKEQQKTLQKYHRHLVGHGRPLSTRIAYMRAVVKFAPFLNGKGFGDVSRDDFAEYMYSLRDLKPNTILASYGALHSFYQWLGGLTAGEDEERYTRILKKERYKPPAGERHVIKAEDLPTHEEIEKIIKYAPTTRDKAAIAATYDLGTRPHELFNLNVGDVVFDEYGAVVTVGEKGETGAGKTGARTLRLIYSLPYLREWLESHPLRDKKDAPLFCRIDRKDFGGRLEPPVLRRVIQKSAKYAGVDRRVYSYLFRHASVTREAGNGFGDQQLKSFYGWTPSSKMLSVYSHLRSEDVNKKRLEQAGIIKPKANVHELVFRACPRCGAENPPTHEYCSKCASPLDEERYRELMSKEEELEALKQKYAVQEEALEAKIAALKSEKEDELEAIKERCKELEAKEEVLEALKTRMQKFEELFEKERKNPTPVYHRKASMTWWDE